MRRDLLCGRMHGRNGTELCIDAVDSTQWIRRSGFDAVTQSHGSQRTDVETDTGRRRWFIASQILIASERRGDGCRLDV